MTAALRPVRPAAAGCFARTEVFGSLAQAEPYWRALEGADALATPYQGFDFLFAWQRHVGATLGVEPFIVVGFDTAGAPLFLWPLGRRKSAGLRIVEFLGGKHANFNVALWRRDVAAAATTEMLEAIVGTLAGEADALILVNQPLNWQGAANPLALLPHQLSPSMGHSGALGTDFEALLRSHTNADARKKMRKKEQRLAAAGTVRFARAVTAQETQRVLDTFFEQKHIRMTSLGLPDVFGDPNVRRFIKALALEPVGNGTPPAELYSLSVDDVIVATKGGIAGNGRFCGMFNSIISDRFASESPGEQLVVHLVRDLCARGFTRFDLGTGEARYKTLFCDQAEPLFDCFIPLTGAGHLYVIAERLGASTKRFIKSTPAAWSLVNAARRLRGRLS